MIQDHSIRFNSTYSYKKNDFAEVYKFLVNYKSEDNFGLSK